MNRPYGGAVRLNERYYGALEGIDPLKAIRKFGVWPILGSQLRFDARPPPLDPCDARFPGNQQRYSNIDKQELPHTESMQQALLRVLPYWEEAILPEIREAKRVLIVSSQAYFACTSDATGRLVHRPANKTIHSHRAAASIRT